MWCGRAIHYEKHVFSASSKTTDTSDICRINHCADHLNPGFREEFLKQASQTQVFFLVNRAD